MASTRRDWNPPLSLDYKACVLVRCYNRSPCKQFKCSVGISIVSKLISFKMTIFLN